MRHYIHTFILLILPLMAYNQDATYIETEAVITNIEFKRFSRRSLAVASVDYTTQAGQKFSSEVNLPHIPYIGSVHRAGQTVKIQYHKDTPMLLKTRNTLFVETYGLYIIIFIGVLISLYRVVKYMKEGTS